MHQFKKCQVVMLSTKEKWNKPRIKLLKKVLFKIQKEIKRRNI